MSTSRIKGLSVLSAALVVFLIVSMAAPVLASDSVDDATAAPVEAPADDAAAEEPAAEAPAEEAPAEEAPAPDESAPAPIAKPSAPVEKNALARTGDADSGTGLTKSRVTLAQPKLHAVNDQPNCEIDPTHPSCDPGPPGLNGTIKIDGHEVDDDPDNEPHIGCVFELDFDGFDNGQEVSWVFTAQAPSKPQNAVIPDGTSGSTTLTTGSADIPIALDLNGITFHTTQGWHVKVSVNIEDATPPQKHKTFWVEGCETEGSSITIVKQIAQGSNRSETFAFAGFGDSPWATLGHDDSQTESDLDADDYTITETVPGGWNSPTINCSQGASVTLVTNGVTIDLGESQHVTCTFTNGEIPAALGNIVVDLLVENCLAEDPTCNENQANPNQTFGFTDNFNSNSDCPAADTPGSVVATSHNGNPQSFQVCANDPSDEGSTEVELARTVARITKLMAAGQGDPYTASSGAMPSSNWSLSPNHQAHGCDDGDSTLSAAGASINVSDTETVRCTWVVRWTPSQQPPPDCDGDGIPDAQDDPADCLPPPPPDCDGDGIPDAQDDPADCIPPPVDACPEKPGIQAPGEDCVLGEIITRPEPGELIVQPADEVQGTVLPFTGTDPGAWLILALLFIGTGSGVLLALHEPRGRHRAE